MSYISTQLSKKFDEVMIWERTKKGRVLNRYPAPWYFYVQDEDGAFSDIYGNKLIRLDFSTYSEFTTARDMYRMRGEKIYESDISAESKVLSEHFYQKEPVVDDHISFFDIEVDYDRIQGMADGENPYAPISAISLYHFWSKKTYMLLLSPHLSKWEPGPKWTLNDLSEETRSLADIRFYNSEKELLLDFFDLIEDTDFICGWNSDGYDVPYIYERCSKLFGSSGKAMLSFPGASLPYYKEVTGKFGSVDKSLRISGRQWIDYMRLFQKFEGEMRPSYSLESITDEILPELPKLEYDGSLYTLYRDDFEHFVRYGIRDSECLNGFENKLGYVRVAIQMARGSTTAIQNVLGTLKVVEDAIINFCHNSLNVFVPDRDYSADTSNEKFTGAAVLKPRMGMHEMVAAVDINSLYPSTIRSLNISPETIIGQFYDNHKAYESIKNGDGVELLFTDESGDTFSKTTEEWKEWLKINDYALSAAGTVFRQDIDGFLPTILKDWYSLRKEFQLKKKNADNDLDRGYYDRLQYIYKILLNSSYGALGNKFFKFFDVRLAESTTRSGREILFHMIAKTSELLTGHYSPPERKMVLEKDKWKEEFHPTSESIIYGDTDSCYFLTYAESAEEAVIIGKAIEKKINKSFPIFCKEAFNSKNNVIQAGLDLVSPKCIFLKPKYYIMHLSHYDGYESDMMKVMGLQIKTTKIPRTIGADLTKFIERLLKDDVWRNIQEEIIEYKEQLLRTDDPKKIGLPKGIKGFEDYYTRWKSNDLTLSQIPGHHRSAILYNECLEKYNDTESPKIVSGSRLLTFYLTKAFGGFKSISIPTDLKILPEWFTVNFVPLIDLEAQGIRLIDKPLEGILHAIGERVPTRKLLAYEDLAEY